MDSSLILPAAIAICVLLVAAALLMGEDETAGKRVSSVVKNNSVSSKRVKVDATGDRRKKMMSSLKELEEREKKLKKARLSLSAKIEQAGLTIDEKTFWLFSLGSGIFAIAVAVAMRQPIYIIPIAGAVAGLGLPRWVLGFLIVARQKKFIAEFAGSIEVIVRGVKSGLPLFECLKIIGREAQEPLAGEFRRVVDSMQMGMTLEQAMSKLYERVPTPEVSFFTIVLAIQQKAGGNLSEALGNLSTVLRARKMMREKVKALSSEAKASAGIIGSLPVVVCILVSVTSPDYMKLLFTDPTGHMMLMVGAGMMGSGILVMRKMINFDI